MFCGLYLWATLIILTREFLVSGVRMIAANKGVVIAAGKMGKLKMIFQSIALIVLLAVPVFSGDFATVLRVVGDILMIIAVILTIWSGAEYLVKNKDKLDSMVVNVPKEVDRAVAERKIKFWGFEIDKLTDVQEKYLSSWNAE